jgi:thiol-disulfide isomerase/thioredoxin/predicted RNA-binding Zn-ribbon protein involved in translation (DUF1610 family)
MLPAVELQPVKCAECGANVSPRAGAPLVECPKCGATLAIPATKPSKKKSKVRRVEEKTPAAAPTAFAPPAAAPAVTAAKPVSGSKQARNVGLQAFFILLSAVVVFGFVRAAKNDQSRAACSALCSMSPAYAGRNRTAPDFMLPDLDGKSVQLSSFRGKTVVLNFWASWCAPCREEMPSLAKLAVIMKDQKDVVFVTVSVDEDTAAVKDTLRVLIATDAEAKEAIGDGPIPFVVLLDPEQKVVRDLYGTTMYPETWVIDKQGFIRMRYDGAFDWASAVAIDAIQSPKKGPGCLAEFAVSRPVGPFASLCDSE